MFTSLIPTYSLIHYYHLVYFSYIPPPPKSTLFPYTTLFRSHEPRRFDRHVSYAAAQRATRSRPRISALAQDRRHDRSEEHTSELQSHLNLVCRLLLEKKK